MKAKGEMISGCWDLLLVWGTLLVPLFYIGFPIGGSFFSAATFFRDRAEGYRSNDNVAISAGINEE